MGKLLHVLASGDAFKVFSFPLRKCYYFHFRNLTEEIVEISLMGLDDFQQQH